MEGSDTGTGPGKNQLAKEVHAVAGLPVSRGTAAAVTALFIAAPLCLSACSSAPVLGEVHASLRTAAGSDVLAPPIPERYIADTTAIGSLRGETGEVLGSSELHTSGELTLTDGVITAADFAASAEGLPELSFTLTQPIMLRRDGQSGETVDAVGTLVVGQMERRDTTIRITPDFSGDSALVNATITLPDSLMHALPETSRVLEVSLALSAAQ